MTNNGVRDMKVYQAAFSIAMEIFEITKEFPKEEKYSLTDQVRRSSRSVCANLSEAYAKRMYPKHFVSKLTDSDGELSETITWLQFAAECKYITKEHCAAMIGKYIPVGKMLRSMIASPEKFAPKS